MQAAFELLLYGINQLYYCCSDLSDLKSELIETSFELHKMMWY
jgi:hypothetical protein